MILFLDVSGTLHPEIEAGEDGHWRAYSGPRCIYAPQLLEVLRPYLDRIEIVLSDWGRQWPDPSLMAALPAELSARIVGTLWLPGFESDYRSDLATPFACIELWLKHRRPGVRVAWLAISCDGGDWPVHARDHLLHGQCLLEKPERRAELAERLRVLLAVDGRADLE